MRRLILALAVSMLAAPAPGWAAGTDQQVAQQLADSLRNSGQMKGYSIAVKYKDGTARLEGTVRSQQQLDQALAIVNRSPDVKRVINNLSVNPGQVSHEEPISQPTPQNSLASTGPLPAQLHTASVPAESAPQNPAAQTRSTMLPRAAQSGPLPRPIASLQQYQPQQNQPPQYQTQQFQAQQHQAQPAAMPAQAYTPGAIMPVAAPQAMLAGQAQQVPHYAPAQGRAMPAMYRQPLPAGAGVPAAAPMPAYVNATGAGAAPAVYDQPHLPNYAWPSYAPYPNYAALTYPKQYSPTAWPYIGPFYPYPQVPLGWRKVTLEWDDGWWFLNFADDRRHCGHGHY